ncbi:Gustatory receptor for sugar taste 64f [Frankliniella fusca]|uniref:Gustatory receptor for sugar taste 64f n=1 Tax=Frankliniella fusca TaxID=407009 RepID=A0AAE1HTP9_9NEOP|nr:Gustatory receptor for sugar taste 64f [Frankliniella fusca]
MPRPLETRPAPTAGDGGAGAGTAPVEGPPLPWPGPGPPGATRQQQQQQQQQQPYSRAPTAVPSRDRGGGSGQGGGLQWSARCSPPSFQEAVRNHHGLPYPHRPAGPAPAHTPMQLFVLGYGERGVHDGDGLRTRSSSDGGGAGANKATALRVRRGAARREQLQRVNGPDSGPPPPPAPAPDDDHPPPSVFRTPPRRHREEQDSDADDGDGVPSLYGYGALPLPPGYAVSAAPPHEHPDAFANALHLPLRIGQALSLMPADLLTGSWSAPRAAYSATVSTGLTILAVLSVVFKLSQKNVTLLDVMVIMFYGLSAIASWLFLRFARYWGLLLRAFRAQERHHGPCPGLRRKLVSITGVLLGVAFVEHGLSEMEIVLNLRKAHANASTFTEYLEIYTAANYDMVIFVIGYWPLLTPFFFFLNFAATFVWNFNDLFIMLMGVALAARFRCLRDSISRAIGGTVALKATPVLGEAYWRSARRSYNALSKLARLVDHTLNIQLLVSFVNNLYFICMQLLRGFENPEDPVDHWWEVLYIMFSFGFLVVRASAVSLFAASVHDHSRSVLDVLYCVSSEDYNEEVYRFLVQVTSEDIALSGFNMFKVTRGLLLTLAGTILTYEVVLVQFN